MYAFADLQRLFMSMDPSERKTRLKKMVYLDPLTERWTCQICKVSFKRNNASTDHIEGQHLRILSYPCFYCETQFTCGSQRRKHIFQQHQQENKMAKFHTE